MKQIISLKEKRVAALLLFVVLAVISLNQFVNKKDYNDLYTNMSSLYKDRLMPAGYLFSINDHLYQKKILHLQQSDASTQLSAQLKLHDEAIAKLIKAYEATYLTQAEKREWQQLLKSLAAYRSTEAAAANETLQQYSAQLLEASFQQAQQSLNELNTLQAAEGSTLQTKSTAIINGTVVHSYLQMAMIVLLGITAIVLLTATEHPFFPANRQQLLN
jgi:Four helix bundle sensory module for signal transduction